MNNSTAPATVTVEGRPVKRLTQAEQEERRRLGLCYNCDEKFSRGHNRVCKRLFLLEGVVEDDEDVEEGAIETSPHFSLHAIAGVHFSDTMQIQVALGDTSLIALLDSGSTHNFISEAAAQRTGLPLQLTISGDTFAADLFVMPLAGYDVVLGTQWLVSLGPILWDFHRGR